MKNLSAIWLILFLAACQSPQPRMPLVKTSGQFIKESVARNKVLQEREESQILDWISKDSLQKYEWSSYGFWYAYLHQNEEKLPTPEFGDLVRFEYSISTLEDLPIYRQEEIGTRAYYMDKEDIFSGMRLALKMMREGEEITFLFPSHLAFGYYGDGEKIGSNLPIKVRVHVKAILRQNHPKNQLTL